MPKSRCLTGDKAGIQEFINRFDVGKQIVFVTNNSTKSRADYKKKLEGLGIPASAKTSSEPLPPLRMKSLALPIVPQSIFPASSGPHLSNPPSSSSANPASKPNSIPNPSPISAAQTLLTIVSSHLRTTMPSLREKPSTLLLGSC
ncbi:MAG: hypothetical protein Q9181_000605 [Wetmoreana brouardii]